MKACNSAPWRKISLFLIPLVIAIALIPAGSAVTLSAENLTFAGPGSTGTSSLVLDSVPQGLAGFKINLTMHPAGIARPVSVSFPSAFSGMKSNTTLPADEVRVVGVDLMKTVEAGATNVSLCTFTLQGQATGSASLLLSVGELTDDAGSPIEATLKNGSVIVGSVSPTPTPTASPTTTPAPTGTPTITPTATPTSTPTATPTPGQVDFTATPRSGQAPLTVNFMPLVNGSVTGYSWSFGDGSSSDSMNPTHVYAAGTYPVSLMVTFTSGGSASATKSGYITVNGSTPTPTGTITPTPTPTPVPLTANFTAAPVTGNPPLAVQFTDLSRGSPTTWRWNFGDGTYSAQKDPLHVYGGIGRYTVTLEIKNREESDIIRKTALVKTTR